MDAAPPPVTPPSPPGTSAWPRAAQLAAALLLGAALTLLAVHAWGYLRWGSRPADLDPSHSPAYRIDLNRADRAALLQLPGVGPILAQRIETFRRENGGFRSVDDLGDVPGIGPATLARLKPWVCVAGANEEPDPDAETVAIKHPGGGAKATPTPAGAKKADAPTEPLDLNTATAAELRKLPGIGPKLSQAIVDEREKDAFKSVDDLRRVHGIGAKTLDKLRPYVTVRGGTERVAARE